MRNLKVIFFHFFLLLVITVKAQEAIGNDDLLYLALKEEVYNHQKDSKEINVILIDAPIVLDSYNNFQNRKQLIDSVRINYTNLKKLRKGNALLVHPIRVENNKLYIVIETIMVKRKTVGVTRTNAYYFYYNCEEKKFELEK